MPKINCRLAAIDLDKTLLDSEYQLTEYNLSAVRELANNSVTVVLASGRMHRTIMPFSRQIGLEEPVISYNGALIKHLKTDETVYHIPIKTDLASEIIEKCARMNLHLNFYLNDVLYVVELNKWSELYDTRTGAKSNPVGNLHKFDGKEPTKLQIVSAPKKIDNLTGLFKEQFGRQLYVVRTQPEYIEFMNPEASKGRALLIVAQKLNIPKEQVVAFGDSENDKSMMEVASFSIAMGNSTDELKAFADFVTTTNEEDGVAAAIYELLL